jgi:hypothetical protein
VVFTGVAIALAVVAYVVFSVIVVGFLVGGALPD